MDYHFYIQMVPVAVALAWQLVLLLIVDVMYLSYRARDVKPCAAVLLGIVLSYGIATAAAFCFYAYSSLSDSVVRVHQVNDMLAIKMWATTLDRMRTGHGCLTTESVDGPCPVFGTAATSQPTLLAIHALATMRPPLRDSWGRPLIVSGSLAGYSIRGLGKDGKPESGAPRGSVTSADSDLIWIGEGLMNGGFAQYLEGPTLPDGPPSYHDPSTREMTVLVPRQCRSCHIRKSAA